MLIDDIIHYATTFLRCDGILSRESKHSQSTAGQKYEIFY